MDPDLRDFLDKDYGRVVAALAIMSGSRAAAEDAVAEAFARAWERYERGQRFASLPAWITKVSTNLLRSNHRRRTAEARALRRMTTAGSSAQPADLSDRTVDVMNAVRQLPRRQREALTLHYWLQMSVKEIAEVLGISEGTVKSALHRGRLALEPRLSGHEEAPL